jgi:hypothetical protein
MVLKRIFELVTEEITRGRGNYIMVVFGIYALNKRAVKSHRMR